MRGLCVGGDMAILFFWRFQMDLGKSTTPVILYFTSRVAASTISVPSNVQHIFAENEKIKKCQNNWKNTFFIRRADPYFCAKCCAAMICEFEGERSNPIFIFLPTYCSLTQFFITYFSNFPSSSKESS